MVILLIGPAGSGKTSLASRIAENDGWVHVSEDEIWGEIGHPPQAARTDAEQPVVHARAEAHITNATNAGLNVVFDFLVYENPPDHIHEYEEALRQREVPFVTRVLRPSLTCIRERQRVRGRPSDRDDERARRHTANQLACLANIDDAKVLDTSSETLEETYIRHFQHLVSGLASDSPTPDPLTG